MVIAYFGADRALLEADNAFTLNRRNMAVLYGLTQMKEVHVVINCIRTTRTRVIKELFKRDKEQSKYINYYIAPILPEKGDLRQLFRPINRFLLKCINLKTHRFLKKAKVINWCYWPKAYYDWNYLKFEGKFVFDTDHNIIEDPNISPEFRLNRKNELLTIGKKSDLILSSSRSMLLWYNKQGFNNTCLMLNGVFSERINLETRNIKGANYTVTYCGTLSKWIKSEWLIQLIQDHPHWQFNIIGANYKTELSETLEAYSNVVLHGFLKPKAVSAILKQSDVAIGLYNENPALDVNSMKLYDYLSQNIPVVINKYHDYLNEDFQSLVSTAVNYEEFKKMVATPFVLSHQKINHFLSQSLWDKRIQNVLEQL
ncbi:glycosyltransferase family protein [Formosa sp. S-31]|uniref:glycosyltransferase family protein n=1 Tax=Formosa sp. S-31 TaxID=2790949 RepID=UPI003EC062FD